MTEREKAAQDLLEVRGWLCHLQEVGFLGDVPQYHQYELWVRQAIRLLNRSEWISVEDRLPEEGVRVLAVKKLKDGRRDLALATCIPEYKHHDYVTGEDIVEPYWVCGGNNNITHWMPLPEMPEEESHGNTET